jgi:hypothetical protein
MGAGQRMELIFREELPSRFLPPVYGHQYAGGDQTPKISRRRTENKLTIARPTDSIS